MLAVLLLLAWHASAQTSCPEPLGTGAGGFNRQIFLSSAAVCSYTLTCGSDGNWNYLPSCNTVIEPCLPFQKTSPCFTTSGCQGEYPNTICGNDYFCNCPSGTCYNAGFNCLPQCPALQYGHDVANSGPGTVPQAPISTVISISCDFGAGAGQYVPSSSQIVCQIYKNSNPQWLDATTNLPIGQLLCTIPNPPPTTTTTTTTTAATASTTTTPSPKATSTTSTTPAVETYTASCTFELTSPPTDNQCLTFNQQVDNLAQGLVTSVACSPSSTIVIGSVTSADQTICEPDALQAYCAQFFVGTPQVNGSPYGSCTSSYPSTPTAVCECTGCASDICLPSTPGPVSGSLLYSYCEQGYSALSGFSLSVNCPDYTSGICTVLSDAGSCAELYSLSNPTAQQTCTAACQQLGCSGNHFSCTPDSSSSSSSVTLGIAIGAAAGGGVLLIILGLLTYRFFKKRRSTVSHHTFDNPLSSTT